MKGKIEWYARGGGILRMGPYKSQVEATKSLRLTDGGYPKDAWVWCEDSDDKWFSETPRSHSEKQRRD